MSKRKRKRKSKKGRHTNSSTDERKSESTPLTKPSRDSQFGLFLIALALLAVAAFLLWRGLNRESLPPPIPMPAEQLIARPLAKPTANPNSKLRFTALSPQSTGVDFAHPVLPDHPMAHLYFSSMASGGLAIGDVNNDGRPDLFIASGPLENRLYLQDEKPLTFSDGTTVAGVGGGDDWGCGATMVDINADGRLDIYVANYDAPNALYINLGDGKFRESAAAYGLNLIDASLEGVFSDYDCDGWLDMYLLTYRFENPDGMPAIAPLVQRNGEQVIAKESERYYEVVDDSVGFGVVGRSDGLLRNNGDGTFSNATRQAGLHGIGHGQSATWWDFDDDGFEDLHVGNDFNDSDRLYHNNGDGTFTDVIRESVPHITWFSMGADFGDLDGDGLFDLLSADMSSTTHFKQKTTMGAMGDSAEFLATAVPRQYMRNALLLNSGTMRFKEAAYLSGLDSTDWTWCVKLADLDCDGRLDVFFTNGSVRSFTDSDRVLKLSERRGKTEWDIYKDTQPLRETNLVYRNEGIPFDEWNEEGSKGGDLRLAFSDQTEDWGLGHHGVSMSAAHGDLDGDGDLDLVVANMDEPLTIYRNDTTEHRRISLRLHGLGGNRFGIGASVEVVTENGRQVKQLQPSRGFLASNQPVLHFGVGDSSAVDVTVCWPPREPGGARSRSCLGSLATDQHYEVSQEFAVDPGSRTARSDAQQMFVTEEADDRLAHTENEFDDYQLQPLLPHRMSRLGPAIAAGDVDGDGNMDHFVGGAARQPARIVSGDPPGEKTSSRMDHAALAADQDAEDMGAVWLDFDDDGDQDLFVVSGGNEFAIDSELYRPRLYKNDGSGGLVATSDVLPDLRVSGGPVAAADFDKDGDVDLFVGGRQIPGKYPLPTASYLLRNDKGKFVDATNEVAPILKDVGMVTGALWSDVDNDADLDLLFTTEWGAIRLLSNDGGQLSDNANAGLSRHRGWWTGISAADLDNDGDMDYIATNLGRNTKYHANEEHPLRIFYGDFEGNGERKLVEAEYEGSTLFPIRGKSCSTKAIPSLADKFPTYRKFALASLNEIYTDKCLEESYECGADWLSSSVLINDGAGHFEVKSLPTEAQLSPCFGCVIGDWTGDGVLDVFLAQNFFSPQPETGNYDGGLGCMLEGRGDGTFRALHTRDTGIVIPGDATAAVGISLGGTSSGLLVATNNGPLRQIRDIGGRESYRLQVTFAGEGSASSLAGVRVSFVESDEPRSLGSAQLQEISSGSGYLSQQPPVIFITTAGRAGVLKVSHPDGEELEVDIEPDQSSVVIDLSNRQP